MTPSPIPLLPPDMYVSDDAGTEYHQLEKTSAETIVKKIDLTYAVYLDELAQGKSGVTERVALRLHLDAGLKSATTSIGDAIRVFETFRLTGDQGLGFSRSAVVDIPFSRLRAVAQQRTWALSHRSEIAELLTHPEEGETGIRATIKASLAAERVAQGGSAEPPKPVFVNRELRLSAEDAQLFDTFLAVIERKMADTEGGELSGNMGVRRGQLTMFALVEWAQIEQLTYDEHNALAVDEAGNLITTNNMVLYYRDDQTQAAD